MKSANSTRTALLLVDIQQCFGHPTYFGIGRSTPNLEENVAKLLAAARTWNASHETKVPVIHIHHHSTNSESPLFPGTELLVPDTTAGKDTPDAPKEIVKVLGTDPMPCAAPVDGEPVMTKSVNSAFIGTNLEASLRKDKVRQLVVVGITTDHCVSTTVRMGANLGVLNAGTDAATGHADNGSDPNGTMILVSDGCAAFGKGEFDGETVHKVNLASLNGEFAEVETTRKVLKEVFEADSY